MSGHAIALISDIDFRSENRNMARMTFKKWLRIYKPMKNTLHRSAPFELLYERLSQFLWVSSL
jgi:hypothetical protein